MEVIVKRNRPGLRTRLNCRRPRHVPVLIVHVASLRVRNLDVTRQGERCGIAVVNLGRVRNTSMVLNGVCPETAQVGLPRHVLPVSIVDGGVTRAQPANADSTGRDPPPCGDKRC